jgi:cation transport ATPase
MVTTHAAKEVVGGIPWWAIERARWVAIQVEGMDDPRLAQRVGDALERQPGVITVQAEPVAHTLVITFDPAVTAPGALVDVVARVASEAERTLAGAITAMRSGPLPRRDPTEP